MNKLLKIIGLVSFITIFTGCVNTTLPANKVYNLYTTGDCCNNGFTKQKLTLKILEPVTSKYLNNTSIYYSSDKYRLQTYKLSKWSDFPTKMILEVLTTKLDGLNLYENITTSYIYAKSDYTLQSELLEFKQIIDNGNSYVMLKIKFYIIEDNRKNIVSRTFSYKTKCNSTNAYGAVEGQNKSLELLIKDLSEWLYKYTKEK